ncbi:glycosyltransferase family 9 protein [Nitratidesulfovibrio vulgaris]|uniref:glycosyltransferase family 9 protein n=1 Tax=Nitratidesulfovibrio vulgaris TaxID=881 RepID=UPI0013E01B42|nr:glycosyltransferase family 9 protein [Nitratidesulfovibrio vulgaris]
MRLVVINLTRFGDLLQTQPALAGLHAQGHETALVCLDNFAEAASLLYGVAHVAPLPGARLLAGLDDDWRRATADITDWCDDLTKSFRPDGVLNLTATLAGRLLARRLVPQGGPLLGFALDEHGFGLDADAWSTFLQAASRDRGCSPFNLVDVIRRVAGVGDQTPVFTLRCPDAERRAVVHRQLAEAAPEGCEGFVALQPGASEDRRRWPVASFAAVGDRLWREQRLCPVLVGSTAEQHLAESYATAATAPFISLVGRTRLPDLAAALSCTRALVTNDTGTMHLAAGLGLPVLAIFLATAQPWDTGPYSDDACCLEPYMPCHPCPFGVPCPHDHACHDAIRPADVAALLLGRLTKGAWHGVPVKGARVWVARRDAHGFIDLASASAHGDAFASGHDDASAHGHDDASASGHEQETRTAWIREQRHFYRQFLDLKRPAATAGCPLPSLRAPDLPCALPQAFRHDCATVLGQASALLHLLGEQGLLLQRTSSDLAKQRFLTTCGRIHALFEQSPHFRALAHLWLSEMQTAGASLDTILQLASLYRALATAWHDHLSVATD